jgi:hypothetical protein
MAKIDEVRLVSEPHNLSEICYHGHTQSAFTPNYNFVIETGSTGKREVFQWRHTESSPEITLLEPKSTGTDGNYSS